MSGYVFYASDSGAKLDSNVVTGGGTDDTEVIQGILDKAVELGSLHQQDNPYDLHRHL